MSTFLLVFFLLFAAVNLAYFISFFSFASAKTSTLAPAAAPVSVIICAKNEAQNLKAFLPSILEQDHLNYEVILINDASMDETLEVMENFQKNDPRIQIVDVKNIEAFWANKKYALTLGIKRAKNSHLLFTDADCAPQSKSWISEMCKNLQQEKSIVLGYGGYFKNKSSFLNKLIRFETLLTAIQYFSYAKMGIPYMGVGRNLAYTSELFYQQSGFASHLHLRSGDDDLFVNEAANSSNTAICDQPAAFTRSVPKDSFNAWIKQKRRHVSTAKNYQKKHKLLLAFFYFSQILFWTLTLSLLFTENWQISTSILGVVLLVKAVLYYKSADRLDEKDVVWLFPILELFLVFAQLGIFIANIFSKPTHWK
ncbi:glycosyltransferase [Salegentibacter sp. F188]|uniref:Glycosyltransferase n=1 Tax=Autumnicola patrickiae TaxID=3075591 RepID=A0ABU3DYT7_9FLAO|nr:glycosyltransferase [Salegentibacter sp. F188]MDT0688886.1 glycosyltransferase [Salegentibacter sp. F188]